MNVKKYIPMGLKNAIKYFFSSSKKYKNITKQEKKIFIMLSANYGNLGDVAITEAQKQFLEKYSHNYKIIEIPINETYYSMKSMKKVCSPKDIITIVGGGNLGNIYESIEEQRRKIIKTFPKNKIISFPQTIDFTEDLTGRKSFKKTIKVYNNHKNLHIFARESKSYEIMKKVFDKNHIYLCPDIVLTLDMIKNEERKNLVMCLRNDAEQYLSLEEHNNLKIKIKELYSNVIEKDTHVGDREISIEERKKYLDEIFKEFSCAKIVITDRLHGMIFCVITKTPCIVIPNKNHKIKATYYDWLQKLEYIKLVEDKNIDSILEEIEKLMKKNDKKEKIVLDYTNLVEQIK